MFKFLKQVPLTLAALLLSATLLFAQVPSSTPPYNQDAGGTSLQIGFTNTARAPGTYDTVQQNNLDKQGAVCSFVITGESGSPSVQLSIQAYDAASKTYTTLASTSAALGKQADGTPVAVSLTTSTSATGAPANYTVVSMHLPRYWRLREVVAGSQTTVTGTASCGMLR